nr:50S ribosomal protein L11 methyltransferase [Roseospirillum parvum]
MADTPFDRAAFIRAQTRLGSAPLVPEIRLHLADRALELWQASEDALAEKGLPPPYWAFAWAGGQALARFVLDHPRVVAGRRVLDLGCGGGLVALAAARAGAGRVTGADIDPFARLALDLNAEANRLSVVGLDDALGASSDWDLILAADICYERPTAERLTAWLGARVAQGARVLLADPGRAYLPKTGLKALAAYDVPTDLDLEDRTVRHTTVYEMAAPEG